MNIGIDRSLDFIRLFVVHRLQLAANNVQSLVLGYLLQLGMHAVLHLVLVVELGVGFEHLRGTGSRVSAGQGEQ